MRYSLTTWPDSRSGSTALGSSVVGDDDIACAPPGSASSPPPRSVWISDAVSSNPTSAGVPYTADYAANAYTRLRCVATCVTSPSSRDHLNKIRCRDCERERSVRTAGVAPTVFYGLSVTRAAPIVAPLIGRTFMQRRNRGAFALAVAA